MLTKMVCAKTVGELVPNMLTGSKEVSFHSLFNTSFNILVGKELLHVGSESKQVTPFGIQVSQTDFDYLKKMYNKVILRLHDDHLFIGQVQLNYSEVSHQNTCQILLEEDEVLSSRPVFTPFLVQTGLDFQLLTCTDLDVYSLIGSGRGLTPSGDDFLVGMLAIHHCYSILSVEELKKIDQAILEKRTTDVSLAYLQAARKGFFTSTICLLLSNIDNIVLLKMYLAELAQFGHTSGRDTISGIYEGITRYLKIKGVA
ncbi:DUF2877 domain-containing protein [Vagococcus jeotgali]|uniref:DUF2877 domain-containing protein n=1 Tax=Vagococcus jeotgali TaxID=3109030 RepID=UPI002DD9C082|nr:DUF2877 domain-containing protein [Vagococcus sp. B2T-5]